MVGRSFVMVALWLVVLAPVRAAEKGLAAERSESISASPRGRLFVLAIGINAYPGKERLSYAVKDARNVAQTLRTKGRKAHRQVEVKLLTDQAADRQGILNGIAWLQREVATQDRAVIYYSGHGARHPGVGFFLVPAHFRDARPIQTMVSGAELKEAAGQIRGSVVVLLDCCHAGAVLNDQTQLVSERNPRVAFLCAARGSEESEERDALRNGIFTRLLIQGLSGKADFNRDGAISLPEVERFLKQRLPRASKGQQHPVVTSARLPKGPLVRP